MDDDVTTTTQACPKCHASMPVQEPYPVWCDQCGWNVTVQQPPDVGNVLARLNERLGRKEGAALLDRLMHAGTLRPTWTLPRLVAIGLATLVHSLTVFLAVAGLLMIVNYWPNLVGALVGATLLFSAYAVRPRLAKKPDDSRTPAELPALYAVTGRIAAALGMANVSAIAIDERFNAGTYRYGLRGRQALWLGLPLFHILDAEERVALIAHEMAHAVNGDLTFGNYIGTALRSLQEWYLLFTPEPPTLAHHVGLRSRRGWLGAADLFASPAGVLMRALAQIPAGVYYLIHRLLWSDRQRAEYLADVLGAGVASTPAMLKMLDKLGCGRLFVRVVGRIKTQHSDESIFGTLQRDVRAMPARERERIRREHHMEETRMDHSHPPTGSRLALVQAHYVASAKVRITEEEMKRIDAELAPAVKPMERHLLYYMSTGTY